MQFRPVVSVIFFQKSHSNPCGYLLIIALFCNCITKHAHGEAVLFLAACYLEKIARFRYRSFILYTK